MGSGLAVKTPDYGIRGCEFKVRQLLPRKGFFSRLSGFLSTGEDLNIGISLPKGDN